MSDSRKKLERAFKLIKHDKTDEALNILRPILDKEPQNAHAWWLLAYASSEPRDVRAALIKVLRIDPNYTNAPKARTMLTTLNEEYPPDPDELLEYPELQDMQTGMYDSGFGTEAETFGGFGTEEATLGGFDSEFDTLSPFEEATLPDSSEPFPGGAFDDVFGGSAGIQDDVFASDPFQSLGEDPFAGEGTGGFGAAAIARESQADLRADLGLAISDIEGDEHDEETLAGLEERVGRRRGRSRRYLFFTFVLVILVLLAVLVVLGTSGGGGETESTDPGALAALELTQADTAQIESALQAVTANLAVANLSPNLSGTGEVVLAPSALGNTAYIKLCSAPDPGLPELIKQSMTFAARQAAFLQTNLEAAGVTLAAVGVSIEDCTQSEPDTLYRAVVPLGDAGNRLPTSIEDDSGWVEYQKLWEIS